MRSAKKIIAAVFALGILMTGCGKQETGDQIVELEITAPRAVTEAQRKAYEKLAKAFADS